MPATGEIRALTVVLAIETKLLVADSAPRHRTAGPQSICAGAVHTQALRPGARSVDQSCLLPGADRVAGAKGVDRITPMRGWSKANVLVSIRVNPPREIFLSVVEKKTGALAGAGLAGTMQRKIRTSTSPSS
jgi:hypothetical protein